MTCSVPPRWVTHKWFASAQCSRKWCYPAQERLSAELAQDAVPSCSAALPYYHRELCPHTSKPPRKAHRDKLCDWRTLYLVKSGERETTCWNSERLMVPSLSMSDSSRIWRGGKG